MTRPAAVDAAPSGAMSCWCHARFGLQATAYNDGLCPKCKNQSPTACLNAHTAERLKALEAAESDLVIRVARSLDIELDVTGAVLREIAGDVAGAATAASRCVCPRFGDTGGFRIADLCCPVHGTNGTDPGDGYWDDEAAVP
jgi:hypothetical protein